MPPLGDLEKRDQERSFSCKKKQQDWKAKILCCRRNHFGKLFIAREFLNDDVSKAGFLQETDVFADGVMKCPEPVFYPVSLEVRFDACRGHRRVIHRENQPATGFEHSVKLAQNTNQLAQVFSYQRAQNRIKGLLAEGQRSFEVAERHRDLRIILPGYSQHSVREIESYRQASFEQKLFEVSPGPAAGIENKLTRFRRKPGDGVSRVHRDHRVGRRVVGLRPQVVTCACAQTLDSLGAHVRIAARNFSMGKTVTLDSNSVST